MGADRHGRDVALVGTGGGQTRRHNPDQAGKPYRRPRKVKNEGGAVTGPISDLDGRFSIGGLTGAVYTVEVTAPGFARNTRLGVQIPTNGSQEISITMNVDAVSQSITVQETVELAADSAPLASTLEATSAKPNHQCRDYELHGARRGFRRGHSAGSAHSARIPTESAGTG